MFQDRESSAARAIVGRHRRVVLSGTVLMAMALAVASVLVFGGSVEAEVAPQSVDPNAPATAVARIVGTNDELVYDIVGGMAIIENDIILGTHAELQANGVEPTEVGPPPTCPEGYQCGVIDTSEQRRWSGGVIPYTISPGTSSTAVSNIDAAIQEWETKTSVRFVPRGNQGDYVEFRGTGGGNTCSSRLGRSGGLQYINYAGTGRGCLVHEIGHAVGLSHEHNRNDRDDYINIDFSNVSGNAASQFRKASGSTDVGEYDFGSAMHYSAYAFALDRSRPVITPKDPSIPLSAVGGQDVLTASDVQAVQFVYGGGTPPPPPTTTTTQPTTTTTTQPTTTSSTTQPTTTSTTQPTTTTTQPATTTTQPTTTITEPTTTSTTQPATTSTQPATTSTQPATTSTTQPATTSTQPATTTTTEPTTTTSGPVTTAPPPPPTTRPETTTTARPTTTRPGPPTTRPPVPPPDANRRPVVEFLTLTDGGTIPHRLKYGGLQVGAYDPDIGTNDGDGIRWVTLVLRDAETGRFLAARREYRSTYDWGVYLRKGHTYTLTAYAVSTRRAGGGWSKATVTVTAE